MRSLRHRLDAVCHAGGMLVVVSGGGMGSGKTTEVLQAVWRHIARKEFAAARKNEDRKRGATAWGHAKRPPPAKRRTGADIAAEASDADSLASDASVFVSTDDEAPETAPTAMPTKGRGRGARTSGTHHRTPSDDDEADSDGGCDANEAAVLQRLPPVGRCVVLRGSGQQADAAALRRAAATELLALLPAGLAPGAGDGSGVVPADSAASAFAGAAGSGGVVGLAFSLARPPRNAVSRAIDAVATYLGTRPLHIVVDDADLLSPAALREVGGWLRQARCPPNAYVWCVAQRPLGLRFADAVVSAWRPRAATRAAWARSLASQATGPAACGAVPFVPDNSDDDDGDGSDGDAPPRSVALDCDPRSSSRAAEAAAVAGAMRRAAERRGRAVGAACAHFLTRRPMRDAATAAHVGELLGAIGDPDGATRGPLAAYLRRLVADRRGASARAPAEPTTLDYARAWAEVVRGVPAASAASPSGAVSGSALEHGGQVPCRELPVPCRLLLVACFYCGVAPPHADAAVFGGDAAAWRPRGRRTAGQQRMAGDQALLPTAHRVTLLRLQFVYDNLQRMAAVAVTLALRDAARVARTGRGMGAASPRAMVTVQDADAATAADVEGTAELMDIDSSVALDYLSTFEMAGWLLPAQVAPGGAVPSAYTCHVPLSLADEAASSLRINVFDLIPQPGKL